MPETLECEELLSDSQEMAEELLDSCDDTPSSQETSTYQTGTQMSATHGLSGLFSESHTVQK